MQRLALQPRSDVRLLAQAERFLMAHYSVMAHHPGPFICQGRGKDVSRGHPTNDINRRVKIMLSSLKVMKKSIFQNIFL